MYDAELHEAAVDLRNRLAKPGGWLQRRATDGKGGYCLVGGVHEVTVNRQPLIKALFDALPENWELRPMSPALNLVYYNNAGGRTQEEVVTLVDQVVNATAPPPPVPDLGEESCLVQDMT